MNSIGADIDAANGTGSNYIVGETTYDNSSSNEEMIHRQHIGYGSIHDGDNVDLQLCCDCFDRLVSECNVSPIEEVDDE